MLWRIILSIILLWSGVLHSALLPSFPPSGMSLPEYWGEEHVWWHGRASFKGEVIAPACTLAMEDTYQAIDMGITPVRDLQDSFSGPEKRFRLRLRNCELAGTGKRVYTASRVRVTFDGLQGETPDKFSLTGQAEGINLQILDNQGYPARVGKVMPPLLLNGNEEGLDYTLRVVRNGQPLKAGDYYAALRFKVDYE
ncbi:fimbrial protein [Escherichia coli]|jgi:type 1 fimbria pilin|uniref:fimbrial protein n=1 Tax=Escherichia coli TaxID=562 RepID=UPI0016B86031|nr:fimbrial protein [Escherichia coli]EFB8334502.1 type 1 fimbrial protein [Escherichia coli]EFK4235289.1 type 1 fimbrial protein [Escherichia coli]EFK7798334.1 type 1 fimbrial protein [Escherichia coli]EGB0884450.1 type 1 fimbrial protein [Escherichia coli]EGB0936341.1 type 1 fimbrial protein [Escherichia coli]